MMRLFIIFVFVSVARSYNIQQTFPTFFRPNIQSDGGNNVSGFFGYDVKISDSSNNELR